MIIPTAGTHSTKTNLPLSFITVTICVQILFLALSIIGGVKTLLIFGIIPIIFLLSKDLFFGIPIYILMNIFILKQTEEVTIIEIMFAFYFFIFFLVWYIKKYILEHKKMIVSHLDLYICIFLFIMVLSIIPGFLFKVSLVKWFREFFPFLTLLIIFPIIDLCDTNKKLTILISSFLLLSFVIAVENLHSYQLAASNVTVLWKIISARQTANEPLFMCLIIVSFAFMINSKRLQIKIISSMLFSFFSIILLITFSRGYWLASMIGIFIIFFILPVRKKIHLLITTLLLISIILLCLELVLGTSFSFILSAFGSRFSTLKDISVDISTLNRLKESQAVWHLIKQNLIIGYGLGKTYIFRPLVPRELPSWYIHNAYLYFWFKTGLIGLLSLLIFYFSAIKNCYSCLGKYKNSELSSLFIGIFALLISMAIVSVSSPQFIEKDALLIIAMSIGITETLRRNVTGFHSSQKKNV